MDDKYYKKYWEDIVYKDVKIDGVLCRVMDEEEVMKELLDYSDMMHRFGVFLCEATGGTMSKLNYTTGAMISQFQSHMEDCVNDALSEREKEYYEETKANMEDLLDRLCPKGGEPLNRGEAIVEFAKFMLEIFHEIKCPECGIVQARVQGYENGKPSVGICPKCNETLFFA